MCRFLYQALKSQSLHYKQLLKKRAWFCYLTRSIQQCRTPLFSVQHVQCSGVRHFCFQLLKEFFCYCIVIILSLLWVTFAPIPISPPSAVQWCFQNIFNLDTCASFGFILDISLLHRGLETHAGCESGPEWPRKWLLKSLLLAADTLMANFEL